MRRQQKTNQNLKLPNPVKNLLRKKGSSKELKQPYSVKPKIKTIKTTSQKDNETADLVPRTTKPRAKVTARGIIKEVVKIIGEETEIDPAHQDAITKGQVNKETDKTTKTITRDPSLIAETRTKAKTIISNALTIIPTKIETKTKTQTTPVGISDGTISPSAVVKFQSCLR